MTTKYRRRRIRRSAAWRQFLRYGLTRVPPPPAPGWWETDPDTQLYWNPAINRAVRMQGIHARIRVYRWFRPERFPA
jgi:hypothetical protein